MDISKILSEVHPSYGETWAKCIQEMESEPEEWQRVLDLMEEFEKRGQQEPGIITFDDEENKWFLADGTHRFVAALELGWTDYWIQEGYSDTQEQSIYESTIIEFTVDKSFDVDDLMDHLVSLMSFRLTGDVWVQDGCISSSTLRDQIEFTICFEAIPNECIELLANKFFERVAPYFSKEDFGSFTIKQEFDFNF